MVLRSKLRAWRTDGGDPTCARVRWRPHEAVRSWTGHPDLRKKSPKTLDLSLSLALMATGMYGWGEEKATTEGKVGKERLG